jgi:O-methyltransferase
VIDRLRPNIRNKLRRQGSVGEPGATRTDATQPELRDLYLELLERALTHSLYYPPDSRDPPQYVRDAYAEEFKRLGLSPRPPEVRETARRAEGRDWPVFAQTMVGPERLRNVRRCVETVLADRIPGDLIEAGCWRGGVTIMMRGVLNAYNERDRVVWAADSFAGIPAPDEQRYPADVGDRGHTADELAVPLEEVRDNFGRYGLLDDQVRFLAGWFRDTLPTVGDHRWAVIRLDGDLYESTMDGLVNLYPGLSTGGYLIIDDYGFDNCRAAVDDYRREHGITEEIQRIDWTGAFWRRGN